MTFSEAAWLAFDGQVQVLHLTRFSPSMHNPCEYKDSAEKTFKNSIIGFNRFVKSMSFID